MTPKDKHDRYLLDALARAAALPRYYQGVQFTTSRVRSMCTSYQTNEYDRFEAFSLFSPPTFEYQHEIFKDNYIAPIFRREEDHFATDPATFALIPRRKMKPNTKPFDTMNARDDSLDVKPSFVGPWRSMQLCLIPCQWFYEPSYEKDPERSERWRIGMADGGPLAIAGLWKSWNEADGGRSFSFTMLTVNADDHPLMKRFHKPGAEKRSVVIVPPDRYEEWLTCSSSEDAQSFLNLYPTEMMHAEPYPLPPRKRRTEPAIDDQSSLF
ncbi:SOS response-associated peptidase [Paraburkholderia sabiae]|uniref:Abasic site processing protein n=1 Tax=Paraburkholderia sabiae TaxID=273251 RepID=A0ABU9QJI0_9BURK|nr:SOS response-associated peptidase family protein [Paraburkholderia sabiae]WJZ79729.1 SOS response-associated peptidase family protein [Paraburkholderia sabiae]CAD6559432.1 hypothetical protein LMG24235_06676 [Paraburkholderia sabiae]